MLTFDKPMHVSVHILSVGRSGGGDGDTDFKIGYTEGGLISRVGSNGTSGEGGGGDGRNKSRMHLGQGNSKFEELMTDSS